MRALGETHKRFGPIGPLALQLRGHRLHRWLRVGGRIILLGDRLGRGERDRLDRREPRRHDRWSLGLAALDPEQIAAWQYAERGGAHASPAD